MAKKTIPGFWQTLTRRLVRYVEPSKYRANEFYFDLLHDDPLIGLQSDNETTVPLIKVNASNAVELPSGAALGGALALSSAGFTMGAINRTATADGGGDGAIASGPTLQFISVTSDNANHFVVLPAPTAGSMVVLANGGTGYKLRTSAPATVALNGGSGASASSSIGANVTAVLICRNATNWVGFQIASAGTVSAITPAA